jgi:hypothetical protein
MFSDSMQSFLLIGDKLRAGKRAKHPTETNLPQATFLQIGVRSVQMRLEMLLRVLEELQSAGA